MWAVTGWAVATWLKITIVLAVGVGAAWVWCSPGWFVVCVVVAGWLSCGPSANSPANGPTKPAPPGGGPHDRPPGRPNRPPRAGTQVGSSACSATAPPVPQQRGPSGRVSRIESNDVELMVTVAANAARCGYLLVGTTERVYARTDADDRVARVPRYEDDAVHQLLRRRWLTLRLHPPRHLRRRAARRHRRPGPEGHPGADRALEPAAPPTLLARPASHRTPPAAAPGQPCARCARTPAASPTPDKPAGPPTWACTARHHQPVPLVRAAVLATPETPMTIPTTDMHSPRLPAR